MKLPEKIVSVLAVTVICGGLMYAYDREHVRGIDLNLVFDKINQQYFAGELPTPTIVWTHLDEEYGEIHIDSNGVVVILVDPNENTTMRTLEETLQHESCHLLVRDTDHGEKFQRCMARFKNL
jgi:hypothetical protein